jgi:hypothetical protein
MCPESRLGPKCEVIGSSLLIRHRRACIIIADEAKFQILNTILKFAIDIGSLFIENGTPLAGSRIKQAFSLLYGLHCLCPSR